MTMMRTRTRTRNLRRILAWGTLFASSGVTGLVVMSAMLACAGTPQAHTVIAQKPDRASSMTLEDERGLTPVRPELGFDHLGFEHTLEVRHPNESIFHELRDGDTAMTGDRIHVSIKTSRDAYLYLAFCTHQQLAIFPDRDGIRTHAGEPMVVPQTQELKLDTEPDPEVVYVILSRTELSNADPRLAAALAAKRPTNTPVDCAASFDAKLAKPASHTVATGTRGPSSTTRTSGPNSTPPTPRPSSTTVLRGARRPKKPLSPPHAPSASPPDEPDFERNPGDIVWYSATATGPADVVAADDDGIAVVRHAFLHVAQP